ncbi:unnamed protein product [Rotaria socialis]|uniref:RNA-dependent RNA polymerase n=1 Tax=Rotaria socialis TaxID=392032 RepID=A0A817NRZ8_9BILA|nr:unnamed protein product [Rotaria socialis]CAF4152990.1 unnamed protein product [Rotaria socialis]
MTEPVVQCTFHNVSTDLVNIISSSMGIRSLSKQNNNQFSYSSSLLNARQIRSSLADTLGQYPQIWFSIDHSNQFNNSSSKFDKNVYMIDHIFFGSLYSIEKFLVHNTPLNNRNRWKIRIYNKQTLMIESEDEEEEEEEEVCSIRLSVPIKFLHKQILVIDGEDFSEIICSYNFITVEIRTNSNSNKKYENICGNNPIVKSLNQCTEFLICLSPKTNADLLLDYLQLNYHFQIFYTTIVIQHSIHEWSMHDMSWYQTDNTRYAISMLHSLGYAFDDKYLSNESLQSLMIALAEKDENNFYQLSLKAFYELRKCHWLNLIEIFNKNLVKTVDESNIFHVAVIHITPTRILIMPKEKTKGHRAMRHSLFQDVHDFCLVYLKPDPPNIYFNDDNNHMIGYFRELFLSGIDFGGNRYHLFGASNSQLKDHSFWFIKALSLNEIHQKRQLLGQFDDILNLGTYVARLGLWFSKTDPTDIKINYCSNENELNQRVRKGEICIMMIEDIERNNYCFTDGNGLVSKGLAKLINEKLTNSQQNKQIIPSAYQIRIAGCKGLIIIDPQSTFDQFYIKIRPSMKKFECNDWTLDICGYSRAIPSRLNNQFIWLLSDLGVSDEAFFRLQQRWFSRKPSHSNYSDDILKNKIPLPVNECRYIYGCALESQLQEGQCFIRYQILNENGKSCSKPKFECVRGRVIVTKNPCPYAGDMLELWAVDLPELYHLNDVIIFSVRGERPDFNKIAGSDLDGDGYFVYWGQELRLKSQVKPLDYTPDKKQYQSKPISPEDVINYCLSTLNMTSSGEIYNLHAIIIDKNYENYQQRTCQPLAIELARMFSSAVDSGKTGYIIDKKRIKSIREKYGQKYPDFLGKDEKRSYTSESIVGKLYRNALNYIHGNLKQLEAVFAQLNIVENEQEILPHTNLPSENKFDTPVISSKSADKSMALHPGSPLPLTPNSVSINSDNSFILYNKIPSQFFLIDGMTSLYSSIQLHLSTKPFYSEHNDLIRLRIELELLSNEHFKTYLPSLSSLFFEQLSSFQYSINDNEVSKLIISYGYIYLLKYQEQMLSLTQSPKTLESLLNNHFLPPLFDTFFPSTILERIEITKDNAHCLQQIFYKLNHTIKQEYMESISDSLCLVLPWFKMNLIEHQREIILICLNTHSNNEIRIHFDKNGRIKSIDNLPKVLFKCFHQQTSSSYRPDMLYEFCSYSTINNENYSLIFKHEVLLDPTQPLTLPLHEYIVPIVSYSIVANIFRYNDIEIHIIRTFAPIHYKNDDFYKLRCILGYIEQLEQQHSIEMHVHMNKNEKLNREKLRYIMALATELSQMLD